MGGGEARGDGMSTPDAKALRALIAAARLGELAINRFDDVHGISFQVQALSLKDQPDDMGGEVLCQFGEHEFASVFRAKAAAELVAGAINALPAHLNRIEALGVFVKMFAAKPCNPYACAGEPGGLCVTCMARALLAKADEAEGT